MKPARKGKCRAVPALLVDAKGAGAALGVSRSAFLRMHAQAAVPAPVTLGLGKFRRTLWAVRELSAWVAAGCPPRHEWAAMKGDKR